jgi:succinoglycan biosynthesis protein ExoA
LAAIARQYWDYGRFKALMLSEEPRSLRPRQLAPVVLLGVVAAAALPRRLSTPARRAVGLYGLALAGVAARSGAGWRTAAALATIHLTWGAGVLVGIAQHAARRR